MKYEKPQVNLLSDATSAIQAVNKMQLFATDQQTNVYNQTISAYEADE